MVVGHVITSAVELEKNPRHMESIEGDSFYAGGTPEFWDSLSPAQKAAQVIDCDRQRPVLEALRQGLAGSWHGYDWEAFDDRLETSLTTCVPAEVVILDGAYSARPELAHLFDLRVLLDTDHTVRRERLRQREGNAYRDDWEARWSEAEDYYFGSVVPPHSFHLVLRER